MQKSKINMDDTHAVLTNLGRIFGVEDKAATLVDGYRKDLANPLAGPSSLAAAARMFLYDSGEDAVFTVGRYAMPTAIIEAAGGVNIMDDLEKSWAKIAWEAVIDRDPKIVVIVNYGDATAEPKIAFLKGNPAFADIDAVTNDRFVVLEYGEATFGPRNIAAVAKVANASRA